VYRHGDAGVVFADAFAPRFPRTVGLNSFHPWNHGDGMSDANLRRQVDAAQALGVESFMLDDQWQGGAGGESGDWRFDPARFPDADHDGVPDFVTYLHAHGLKLGLWMSPLEFNSASETAKAHPDWICTPTGDVTAQVPDDAGLGVWDATNPAFQDYLTGVVDRLVAAYDVREFKFDFMAWVDCPPHDYLDYEDAFRALVRRFEARHPGVTFELDETNDQRLWPFASAVLGPSWFDNGHLHGSTAQAKLLHDVWTAAPWLPPSEIGTGLYDGTLTGAFTPDFLMPVALLGHVTFWSDLTKLTADQRSRTAQWIAWYKAHRGLLSRGAYELTAHDPLDGRGWAAFEPHRGRAAALFAFRQAGGDAAQTFVLQGLDPDADYTVVRAPDGAALGTFSGARLMSDGLRVALPEQSAAVLLATPDRRTPAGG
jgi:alpha-galactosidase